MVRDQYRDCPSRADSVWVGCQRAPKGVSRETLMRTPSSIHLCCLPIPMSKNCAEHNASTTTQNAELCP